MKKSTEADIKFFKSKSFNELMDFFFDYDCISIYFRHDLEKCVCMRREGSEKFYIIVSNNYKKRDKKRIIIFLYCCIGEGLVVDEEERNTAQYKEKVNKFVEEFNALYNK